MKHIYTFLFCIAFYSYGFSQYHFNKAAHFTNGSYYASVTESNFDIAGPVTIEAWINIDSVALDMMIVGKNFATSYAFGLRQSGPNAAILRFNMNGSFVNGTGVIPMNTWTHVAVTYDAISTVNFYINGVADPVALGAIAGPIPNTSDEFKIGADQFGGLPNFFFRGGIDEVRIWNNVLPGNQIRAHMHIPMGVDYGTGTALYVGSKQSFRMNTANATDTMRSEVYPYNQVVPTNIQLLNYSNKTSSYIDYNSHLVFDGNAQYYIDYNNSPNDLKLGKSITAEVWVRIDTTVAPPGGYMNIFNQSGGTSEYPFGIYADANSGTVYFGINSGNTTVFGGNIRDQHWHHLAGTYQDNTGHMQLFIDGALVDSTTNAADSIPQSTYTYSMGSIGATSFAGNRLVGGVDEARIWKNVIRTQADIKKYMYIGLDASIADPKIDSLVVFGLDGITRESNKDVNVQTPKFYGNFSGTSDAHFASTKSNANAIPTSPLIRLDSHNYPVDFITSQINQPINDFSSRYDTIAISGMHITADPTGVEVFFLADHTYTSDISIWLYNSQGDSVRLVAADSTSGCAQNDMMTIFSVSADSVYNPVCSANGNINAFSPSIQPWQSYSSVMNGSANGNWTLKVSDEVGGDVGYWFAWGLRITGYYIGIEPVAEKTFRSYNYPNPFDDITTIFFDLPYTKDVQLKIYDQSGRIMRNQLIGNAVEGANYYQIDLSDLASGVYFYELISGDARVVNKMIVR